MELTAAEPRRKGLVQLYLDGEPGPKVDGEVFALSRLRPGASLTEEQLRTLVEESDARRAREKALTLLEHRAHSKRELTEKVARTAASRQAAQAAADRLEELGLLNDETYAQNLAKELFERRRFGARRVLQELLRRGIGRETAQRAMAPYGDRAQETGENIALVLERRYPLWREDEKTCRRAVAALQRMGYTWEEIHSAMGAPDPW